MLRGMVFVDHMNFNIALGDYYSSIGKKTPNLDYNTIFRGVVSELPDVSYTKTTIFAPEPDSFLMNDPYLRGYYKWVQGMKNAKYLDVVEGRYIGRPVTDVQSMDISDKSTYYKVEKGTDINLAIHAITKAYSNAYDIAFVFSGDTDYISLYRQLKAFGKLIVVVAVKGQKLGKIIPEVDDYIILDDSFFSKHIRACLKNANMPNRRVFCPLDGAIFPCNPPGFLRKNCLPAAQNPSLLDTSPIFKQALENDFTRQARNVLGGSIFQRHLKIFSRKVLTFVAQ